MKLHYLSPYSGDGQNTICGKVVSEGVELVADPVDITCIVCRRTTMDHLKSQKYKIFQELATSVKHIEARPTTHETLIVSKTKVDHLQWCVKEIERLQTIINLLEVARIDQLLGVQS